MNKIVSLIIKFAKEDRLSASDIAELILYTWVNPKDGQGYRLDEIPRYSTDIAAAWEVVEKLKADHALTIHAANHAGYGWLVHIDSGIKQIGDTAPHAICLAALKAVGA